MSIKKTIMKVPIMRHLVRLMVKPTPLATDLSKRRVVVNKRYEVHGHE